MLASASLASHTGVLADSRASPMWPKNKLSARCGMGHVSLVWLDDAAFQAQELDPLDETDADDPCLSKTISLAVLWSSPLAPFELDVLDA